MFKMDVKLSLRASEILPTFSLIISFIVCLGSDALSCKS